MNLQREIELTEIRNRVKDFLNLVNKVKRQLEDKGYSFPKTETAETSSLPSDKAKSPVTSVGGFCGGGEVGK